MTRPDDQAFASPDHGGLTIREYMATTIMAGFAAAPEDVLDESVECNATTAVRWADALIAALNR